MRTPSLLADFIHARDCKPFCEKLLTLPKAPLPQGKSDGHDHKLPTKYIAGKETAEQQNLYRG